MDGEVSCTKEVPVAPALARKLFRDVARWPLWFDHLARAEEPKPRLWRITMKAPGGGTVSWECDVTMDDPNEVAWASSTGAVVTYGSARFDPFGDGGCRITFRRFHGVDKKGDARIISESRLANPQQKLEADLARFCQVLARVQQKAPVQFVHVGTAPAPAVRSFTQAPKPATRPPARPMPSVTRFPARR